MALLGLLGFLLLPAGAIALLYLVAKAIARHANGPTPSIDPTLPPPSRTGERIAVVLVLGGAVSLAIIWVLGSALAIQ